MHILGDPTFDHRPQLFGHGKESIRRTEAVERLVGPLVVVVLHPQPNPLPRLVEAVELGATEKLLPNRLPEPLHLAQRHRMMRPTAEVMHPVFLQFLFEACLPTPRGVLPAVVGEHLLGHAVLPGGRAVDLQHVFGRLAAEQTQADKVARMII